MSKIHNLQIFETGNRFGFMSTSIFPKDMPKEEKKKAFLENRTKAAKVYGFDPLKFYIPCEKGDGSSALLTREMIESTKDGWDLDIPADILMVKEDTPDAVIGVPVADCAVLMMSDRKQGVSAVSHCSGANVNNLLPIHTLEALKSNFDSKEEDIFVYVSACAGNNWWYDRYPKWATNDKIWYEAGAIKEEDGVYKIDLRRALLTQLELEKFRLVTVNPIDTITSPSFYSNHAASHGEEGKMGRHFAGVFYKKR